MDGHSRKSRHPDGGGPDEEKRPYLYHQTLGLGGASATDYSRLVNSQVYLIGQVEDEYPALGSGWRP